MSFVIDEIKIADRGKMLEPLRLQFEHCQAGLKPESLESTKTGIYNDKDNKNEYVAVCQIGDQHYMGSTKGQNQKESQTLYIALKHKVSNKVKLVEISKVILSPVVQNLPTTNPVLTDNDERSNGATDSGFVNRFGMLKRQRMHDQAQRLTVKAENFEANLENAAAGTAIQNSELALPKNSDSFEEMLPPRKLDTKLASEVYQIENIISLNDMEALEENTKRLMKDDPDVKVDTFKEFSDYFTKEFKRLKSADLDKNEKLQRVKALLYTEGLIKFSAIKRKTITHVVLDESLPSVIPKSVKTSILENFSCQEGRSWILSQMCREKTICHAIALALAIGNCIIETENFSSSLKLEMTKFETLIRVVGARIVKGKSDGDSKIVLKIPLAVLHKKG